MADSNWLKAYDAAAKQLYGKERVMDRSKSFENGEGQWLKADDIKGRAVKAVISQVVDETFEDFKTKNPVNKVCLRFEGKEKGLVLNTTNGKKLVEAYGADDASWVGKEVGLEYHYYDDFGKAGIVLSILDKEFDDDIPF